MAIQFRSLSRRKFWLGVVISYAIDVAMAYVAAVWFETDYPLLAALCAPLAIGLVGAIFAAYGFAKQMAIFYAFDRKPSIQATIDAFRELGMPAPEDDLYDDAEEYLRSVAVNESANAKARFVAAVELGRWEAFRQFGPRSQLLAGQLIAEAAIRACARSGVRKPTDSSIDAGAP